MILGRRHAQPLEGLFGGFPNIAPEQRRHGNADLAGGLLLGLLNGLLDPILVDSYHDPLAPPPPDAPPPPLNPPPPPPPPPPQPPPPPPPPDMMLARK